MFNIPILLIIFNRPQTTQRVFDAIRLQQPKHLYVAADGPRKNKPDDIIKCHATRNILNQVDWECDLKTLFRDSNMGCGKGPANAITWFFDHVEQGIILEDDCLPSPDFFIFCAKMLIRFKNEHRISVISGTNPLIKWRANKKSYIFSKFGSTWGWASWRRSWINFDHTMKKWHTNEGKLRIKRSLERISYYNCFKNIFDEFSDPDRRKDVWDYQWLYSCFFHSSFTVVPTVNLISNIGFGEDSTHTVNINHKLSKMPIKELNFPLKNHKYRLDKIYEWIVFEKYINPAKRSFKRKAILKILKMYYGIQ